MNFELKTFLSKPHTFSHYPVQTGELDQQRLTLLNKLYNPISKSVFIEYGISDAHKILEIGCGGGEFACWLATMVGPNGYVFAIDNDAKQIEIASKLAKSRGITNIEFCQMSLENIPSLKEKFDFVYARWVLMYVVNKTESIRYMYNALDFGGTLICEDIDSVKSSILAYPETDILEKWISYWESNFTTLGLKINFFEEIYDNFSKLSLQNITLRANQPILLTQEEKSIFRLGINATRHNVVDVLNYNKFLDDVIRFEKQNSLIWYFRNTIIAGKKLNFK
jgi:ubiquinone/menaquinone biosynthesis C-methylase UbiE